MDTSVPFRDVRNSDLSNNHIDNRQTDSVFYHQSHHGDLKASRCASVGSMNMSRNIDGISLIGSSASVLGISNIP